MHELTIIPEDAPATELTKFSLEIGGEPDGYRVPSSILLVRDDAGVELAVDLRTWQDPFTEASP